MRRLFDAALERGPDSLPTFLERACGVDASLRQEVETLLASHYTSEDFLRRSPLGLSAAQAAVDALADEDDTAETGRHIGFYRVVREIGRGGMGTVYLAERADGQFEQRVAVKLIRRGMDALLVLRRFRNECQILAGLEHPNIARLIDGGMAEDGRPYLIMEYVEGVSVDKYCDSRKLPLSERLRLFRKICSAVQFAHQNSVVHRDLKPSNILVTDEGVPKLLDFGIAKVFERGRPLNTTPSTITSLQGMTPEYASPEQIRGEPITAASDVYSLGVLFYELLTGHRPYDLSRKSTYEIARAVCEAQPARPSAVVDRVEEWHGRGGEADRSVTPATISRARALEPGQLRRKLSGDLDTIVLKALQKASARRYGSVAEFSEDIRRHLESQPIRARRDSLTYRAAKFLQRNRVSVLASLAAALLCLLLGLWIGVSSTRPEVRDTVAILPIENTNIGPEVDYISDGVTDYLIRYFSHLPQLTVPGRNSVYQYKGRSLDPTELGHELGVKTLLTGRITTSGESIAARLTLVDVGSGRVVWSKQYTSKASEILALQQKMADDVLQTLAVPVSAEERTRTRPIGTESAEAYQLYTKGSYYWGQRTDLCLRTAAQLFQQAVERDPEYSLAYSGLANSYSILGASKQGLPEENFSKAKAAALKAVVLDGRSAEAHTSLALVTWLYDWDWEAADKEFRLAIALEPNYVTAHHWYGLYLAEMGRFDEAVASEKRALELDPLSLYVTADLGRVYFYARRYEDALAQYQKALEMGPTFSTFYAELIPLYEQMAKWEELLSVWRLAPFPDKWITRVRAKGLKGYWQEQLRLGIKPGPGAPHYHIAEAYARLGRRDQAFRALEEAFKIRDHQMAQLKVNPAFDNLRPDRRFDELLSRMNLKR